MEGESDNKSIASSHLGIDQGIKALIKVGIYSKSQTRNLTVESPSRRISIQDFYVLNNH